MKKFVFVILFLVVAFQLKAQKDVTTFGLEVSPIIPTKFFEGDDVESSSPNDSLFTVIGQRPSYRFGMSVRHGFSDMWAVETGIKYVQRKYRISGELYDKSGSIITDNGDYRLIGFEIPIKGLVWVRFTEKFFMNVAAGFSFDPFASDLRTNGDHFKQYTLVKPKVNVSMLANIGFEWRTDRSGYFYIGSSFHRPFLKLGQTEAVFYDSEGRENRTYSFINGNYISVDFKYFFHEDPERRERRKNKRKSKS